MCNKCIDNITCLEGVLVGLAGIIHRTAIAGGFRKTDEPERTTNSTL